MKTIVIKSQITLEIDEEYDEDALLKANDWHQKLGSFLALVDKTLTTGCLLYTSPSPRDS